MTAPAIKSFIAVLEPLRTRLRWVIVRIPFDVGKTWPERRGLRVRGEIFPPSSKIAGFPFRTSLFPASGGKGHFLLVNKKMQAAAKATVGSRVQISLEPDLEERAAMIPPELARALKGDRRLPKWFDGLSYSCRKEIGDWVSEPTSATTRTQRAEAMAERLVLTLEGEIEPPPILQAAFRQQPLARQGWEAMTVAQRRNHLLGIFYYQSIEARERRAAKAVEEALRANSRLQKSKTKARSTSAASQAVITERRVSARQS
ncbi:MAG: YdeI/OmpD-associated family protein [Terracidiphilus sp.]|jgi:uncharacterized protein YdeI (YjbR/CyaY-like superfamily)